MKSKYVTLVEPDVLCSFSFRLGGGRTNFNDYALLTLTRQVHLPHFPSPLYRSLTCRFDSNVFLFLSAGAFKPCEHLLGNWMIRLTVWFICLVALVFNSLVLVATFSPTHCNLGHSHSWSPSLPPARLLMGLLALANLLTGIYVGVLTVLDAATWGSFAEFGVWWEMGPGCQFAGSLAVFSSEWAVLLLLLAAVERSVAVRDIVGKVVMSPRRSSLGRRGCWKRDPCSLSIEPRGALTSTRHIVCQDQALWGCDGESL